MTYGVGNTILASDYNTFRGDYDTVTPYPDDATATDKLAALVGVGYGVRGYGQSIAFPAVAAGDTITAAQWNTIRSIMNLINVHTGAGLTLQAAPSPGDPIDAYDGSVGRADIPALISSLDSSKILFLSFSSAILYPVLVENPNTSAP